MKVNVEFETEQELMDTVKAFYSKKAQETERETIQEDATIRLTADIRADILRRLAEGETGANISRSYGKKASWVSDLKYKGQLKYGKRTRKRHVGNYIKVTADIKRDIEERLIKGQSKSFISRVYKRTSGWVNALQHANKVANDFEIAKEKTKREYHGNYQEA